MKLHQLSVFIENRPGQLLAPVTVLSAAGINIVTLSLADTQQFGILRLIVKDWQVAKSVLEKAGFVVNIAAVIAIEVEDKPGGLAEVLKAIEKAGINLEYMYAFTDKRENRGVLVFRFEDPDKALAALQTTGVRLVESVDLYQRLNA